MTQRLARIAALSALCSVVAACAAEQVQSPSALPSASAPAAEQREMRLEPIWRAVVNPRGDSMYRAEEPSGLAAAPSGIIVAAAQSGSIHGFDAWSGDQRWLFELEEPPTTPPSIASNTVYIGVADGRVVALDVGKGEELWTAQLPGIVHGQPVISDGTVYVMTSEEALVALDQEDGALRWAYRRPRVADLEIKGGCRPSVIDGDIYIGFSDGALLRIDAQGKPVWSADLSRGQRRMIDVDSSPIAYRNLIIAASHSGGLSAVHRDTGRIEWSLDRSGITTPIMANGTLIATTAQGSVLWVDPESGRLLQELEMSRPGLTSPMRFTDETFVVGDASRGIFVMDVNRPKLHAVFEPSNGSSGQPTFFGDTLYVLTNRGQVYGLRASLR